ncbi:MAG: hypothetical protein DRG83_15530 [Deltaproteobacteria bacterium]|nr:MAG: hypothetical protein DRG83_15530 [Deltaproteobacteria bacterium]
MVLKPTTFESAVEWFSKAVLERRIDPLNLNLSDCPESILDQLSCEITPDGEEIPTQDAIEAGLYLYLECKDRELKRKTGKTPKQILAKYSEVYETVITLVIMATMEKLKRKGLLDYHYEGTWYDGSAQVFVSDVKPYPFDISLLHTLSNFVM